MGEFEGFSAWCMEVIRGDVGFSYDALLILALLVCRETREGA